MSRHGSRKLGTLAGLAIMFVLTGGQCPPDGDGDDGPSTTAKTFIGTVEATFANRDVPLSERTGPATFRWAGVDDDTPQLEAYEGILPGFNSQGVTAASVDLGPIVNPSPNVQMTGTVPVTGTVTDADGNEIDLADLIDDLLAEPLGTTGFIISFSIDGVLMEYEIDFDAEGEGGSSFVDGVFTGVVTIVLRTDGQETDTATGSANAEEPEPQADDADGDGVLDDVDNCPTDANANQADADDDDTGDVCDNCLLVFNIGQFDADLDTLGDACDNCPDDDNFDQADADGDGVGDVCDNCPDDANADQIDSDGDGLGEACDTELVDNVFDVSITINGQQTDVSGASWTVGFMNGNASAEYGLVIQSTVPGPAITIIDVLFRTDTEVPQMPVNASVINGVLVANFPSGESVGGLPASDQAAYCNCDCPTFGGQSECASLTTSTPSGTVSLSLADGRFFGTFDFTLTSEGERTVQVVGEVNLPAGKSGTGTTTSN
jgi:hypothetical protein